MKNTVSPTLILVISLLSGIIAHAQGSDSTLVITSNGCHFSIPLPKGWVADTAHAKEYQADIVLYRQDSGLSKEKPVIGVACFKSNPQNPSMQFHPEQYSADKRMREIQHDDKAHKNYTYIRMMMQEPNSRSADFINYINPNSSTDCLFSVSMQHGNSRDDVDADLTIGGWLTLIL